MDIARPTPGIALGLRTHHAGAACVTLQLLATSWVPTILFAQSPVEAEFPGEETFSVIARADSLLEAGAADEALGALEDHLAVFPDDVEARWRAARAATVIGLLSPLFIAARPFYRIGIEHADASLTLAPNHTDALTWSMAAKGRLALWTGARETADLAQDVWAISHRLLAEDEDHALAHHALGVLHFQVSEMSRVKRFLARILVGGDALSDASWEAAFLHLARAVELEPSNKMFRLAYAQALAGGGRRAESMAEVDTALAQPITGRLNGRHHYLIQRFRAKLQR